MVCCQTLSHTNTDKRIVMVRKRERERESWARTHARTHAQNNKLLVLSVVFHHSKIDCNDDNATGILLIVCELDTVNTDDVPVNGVIDPSVFLASPKYRIRYLPLGVLAGICHVSVITECLSMPCRSQWNTVSQSLSVNTTSHCDVEFIRSTVMNVPIVW